MRRTVDHNGLSQQRTLGRKKMHVHSTFSNFVVRVTWEPADNLAIRTRPTVKPDAFAELPASSACSVTGPRDAATARRATARIHPDKRDYYDSRRNPAGDFITRLGRIVQPEPDIRNCGKCVFFARTLNRRHTDLQSSNPRIPYY